MSRLPKIITYESILFGAAVGLLSAAGIHYYKKWKNQSTAVTKEWRRIGVVSELYLYPLKSGHRIQLESGYCTKQCLKMKFDVRDRSFVVYNPGSNQCHTARDYPKLVNVKLEPLDENTLTLEALHYEPQIQIKVYEITTESKIISLFPQEEIAIRDCSDEAAEWLSNYLLGKNTGLRLGFYDSKSKRDITKTHGDLMEQYKNLNNDALGLQSDLTSYLIINQASVDELSAKVKTDNITIHNFRPNIVIKTDDGVPYAEDNWEKIKIGNVELYHVCYCTRCGLSTVDPVQAEKNKTEEPLKTLRSYRKLETIMKNAKVLRSSPVMGILMALNVEGQISVGDSVYVQLF